MPEPTTPTHVYVVTDRGGISTPVVRRYRFRTQARGGITVWDRGAMKYLRYTTRGQTICTEECGVRNEIARIVALRRAAAKELIDALDRMERTGVPVEHIPESGVRHTSRIKL